MCNSSRALSQLCIIYQSVSVNKCERVVFCSDSNPSVSISTTSLSALCVTLALSVSLYLSDAGSLRQCRQLAVKQLPVNRSSSGQVSLSADGGIRDVDSYLCFQTRVMYRDMHSGLRERTNKATHGAKFVYLTLPGLTVWEKHGNQVILLLL